MKYICLGYLDERKWDALTPAEREDATNGCHAFCDALKRSGNLLGTEGLQSSRNAATLRLDGGKVAVTDGPFAETKEQLGGLWVLEAKDLNHAIQLMSKHPGLQLGGGFEIRPSFDEHKA